MFDFEQIAVAKNTKHAIELLSRDENSFLIAGGSDILIKIREGKLNGCKLVSIAAVEALRGVVMDEAGGLVIGPLTTFSEMTAHALV